MTVLAVCVLGIARRPLAESPPRHHHHRHRQNLATERINIDDDFPFRVCVFFLFFFFPLTFIYSVHSSRARWDSSRRDTQLVAISSQVVSRRTALFPYAIFWRLTRHFITFCPFCAYLSVPIVSTISLIGPCLLTATRDDSRFYSRTDLRWLSVTVFERNARKISTPSALLSYMLSLQDRIGINEKQNLHTCLWYRTYESYDLFLTCAIKNMGPN